MTSTRRRATERVMREGGYAVPKGVPEMEARPVRTAREIAERLACLAACALRAIDGSGPVRPGRGATEDEVEFLSDMRPDEGDAAGHAWGGESCVALLWALGHVESLPCVAEPSDFAAILDRLYPATAEALLAGALVRCDEDLRDAADVAVVTLAVSDAAEAGAGDASGIDRKVAAQRSRALGWVVGEWPWPRVTET